MVLKMKTIKQIKFELIKDNKELELNDIIRAIKKTAIEDYKNANNILTKNYIYDKFNLCPKEVE